MPDTNSLNCARCGHSPESHQHGLCRDCWQQEQRWGHVQMDPPRHEYRDPQVPDDVEQARRDKIETTRRALHHMLADWREP